MNQTASPSPDDIAYIRQVAESGARAPLIGGRFMAWWGLLLIVAYPVHYLAVKGLVGDGGIIFGIIWGSFGLLGATGQALLSRSIGDKPGAGSAGNLASRSVWAAGAFSILAMVIGSAIVANHRILGPQPWDYIAPVGFAVYACALIVTGSLAGNAVLKWAGAGSVAMVGVYTAFIYLPERYLLAAAGIALTVFLPGLLLLRAEPRARA